MVEIHFLYHLEGEFYLTLICAVVAANLFMHIYYDLVKFEQCAIEHYLEGIVKEVIETKITHSWSYSY